jgi:hypothetical protein
MRRFALYLRSRRVGQALGGILLVAFMVGLLLAAGDGRSMAALVAVLPPAGMAAIIGLSAATPFGPLERSMSFPLAVLRLGHLGGLVLVAALTLGAATLGTPAPLEWVGAVVRNLLGYAGLALLVATLLAPAYSWSLPVAYAIAVLAFGDERLWAWPLRPATHQPAAALSFALLVAGLGLMALWGPADAAAELEA